MCTWCHLAMCAEARQERAMLAAPSNSCALEDPMRISPPHRLLGTADARFRRRRLRDAFVQSFMINARPPALSRGGSRFYRLGAKASDGDSYGQAGLVENAYPSRAGS